MKVDKRQLLNTVIYARNIREQIISSTFTPKANFFCIRCGKMRPFGGDLAIQYYGNPGVTLFCNECLEDFEAKLRRELDVGFYPHDPIFSIFSTLTTPRENATQKNRGPLAQLVEQLTLNQ